MEARPEIKPEFSKTDKRAELLGWLILLLLWCLTLYNYLKLPNIIPIHFNASGKVDNYGGKSTIIVLPVIGTVIFIGLTILNKHPRIFNYPVSITADNALRHYTNATRMIRYLKLAIVIIFTSIIFIIYKTATGKTTGPATAFLPFTLVLIFISQILFIMKFVKTK